MVDNNHSVANPVGRFMVAVGAIIASPAGKILLVQRAADLDWQANEWEICYGRIAQFETPEEGLRREVAEELGITDLEIMQLLTAWHIFRGEEKAENELVGLTYACITNQTEISISAEHQACQWVTPEQALQLVNVEGIKRDIRAYLELTNKRQDEIPLDAYEAELKEFLDAGDFEAVDSLEQVRQEAVDAANNYFAVQGNKKVTIRLNKADLITVKAKAKESGIPYQNIIQSLVHQCAQGKTKIQL